MILLLQPPALAGHVFAAPAAGHLWRRERRVSPMICDDCPGSPTPDSRAGARDTHILQKDAADV